MITLKRTNSEDKNFVGLVKSLDKDLQKKDGDKHPFNAQFNKIDKIKYVVVAFENEKPVGCGAIKKYNWDTMEIKRMFVQAEQRRKDIATKILIELENWTKELNLNKCILETGREQPEAIGLYKKSKYKIIPNYDQYKDMVNSICFEKKISF
jgi:GNAT superfamily N-acetyltransferase